MDSGFEVDDVIRAVQIAHHVDGPAPVRVVWTREEDIQARHVSALLVRPHVCEYSSEPLAPAVAGSFSGATRPTNGGGTNGSFPPN